MAHTSAHVGLASDKTNLCEPFLWSMCMECLVPIASHSDHLGFQGWTWSWILSITDGLLFLPPLFIVYELCSCLSCGFFFPIALNSPPIREMCYFLWLLLLPNYAPFWRFIWGCRVCLLLLDGHVLHNNILIYNSIY